MKLYLEGIHMTISFPKRLINNVASYEFLINLNAVIQNTKKEEIVFDLSSTKTFDTNLLAILNCIVDESDKNITLIMPKEKRYPKGKSIISIFNYYANDKRAFFKPRIVVGNSNVRETEDLLKQIKLQNYDKLKVLLSEIIANIKMHVVNTQNNTKGYVAASYDEQKNAIFVSVVNNSKTILEKLNESKYEFNSDEDAIVWALKKHNSTRDSSESGGIGLYLLRKYTSELKANTIIVSGNTYMEINDLSYDEQNENNIWVSVSKAISKSFKGTIVTIAFPYEIEKSTDDRYIKSSLVDILEV